MSGIHTPRADVEKRLAYYRQIEKRGTQNWLVEEGLRDIMSHIDRLRASYCFTSHHKQFNQLIIEAKKAKMANDIQALEKVKEAVQAIEKSAFC